MLLFHNPIENGPTFLNGPHAPFRCVDVVGGAAAEAAAGLVIAGLDRCPDSLKAEIDFPAFGRSLAQPCVILELADAVFDHAIVARVVRRTIERDDAVLGQQGIDEGMVERAAIVALEEQGCPMPIKLVFQPHGDFGTVGRKAHQRFEAEARGQVAHGMEPEPDSIMIFGRLSAIEAPSHLGYNPLDAFP